MSAFDEFAASLLEEAKRFLEKAVDAPSETAISANLHASLMLAFCALEAHINAIADELALRSEFSIHERALLLEQDVRLEQGEFQAGGLKMVRLEDRILFLHFRIGGRHLDRNVQWWQDLSAAMGLRNQLTHPKAPPAITVAAVRRAIEAIVLTIDVVYKAVYGRPFPFVNLGSDSTMNF